MAEPRSASCRPPTLAIAAMSLSGYSRRALTGFGGSGPAPVVLLLGWLAARERDVAKYQAMYQVRG